MNCDSMWACTHQEHLRAVILLAVFSCFNPFGCDETFAALFAVNVYRPPILFKSVFHCITALSLAGWRCLQWSQFL